MKPYFQTADGRITIFHGDCRDVLSSLELDSIDVLLTDPPYGMQFSGQGEKSAQANVAADGVRQGVRTVRQALFEAVPLLRSDAHLLMFCHWQSWPDFYDAVSAYAKVRNALIWHKESGGQGSILTDYLRNYEVILYATRGQRPIIGTGDYSAVLSGFKRPPQIDRRHPTEKPVSLLKRLVYRHCPQKGVVLDPFMGSGSTLEAAQIEGRRAIGIEIEERYAEIAARRLDQLVLPLEAS